MGSENIMAIPTEETEQITLFNWARTQQHKYPELRLMYHIPNGGQRSKSEAARFKAAGVRAGVPDIFLPCPRSRYHGLYIELKRVKGGRVSGDQESLCVSSLRWATPYMSASAGSRQAKQ